MTQFAPLPYYKCWPEIESAIAKDPQIESEIDAILHQMTIEEKVGQMIQPNLRDVTPEEVRQYKLGSILNGGGSWPNENKYASASEWARKADEFWQATEEAFRDRPFRIPFIWATDAVHGHNNVFGSTVFPHNIGLGAARDSNLIERIGSATAIEVCATGLDWTFAPTVAIPRNLRWGRVYEGYSEDPHITYHYASAMVRGLQGCAEALAGEDKVISNVKHWLGDGGTENGTDRGINRYSEEYLINLHAMGYFSGLNAGAQVVMSSFNSWSNAANYDHSPEQEDAYNNKIHGSHYLLTEVLKNQMGFDGIVITDWNGHSEVSKCSNTNATYAINAGNDVLMVPVREHWPEVYKQTLKDISAGTIGTNRIDDAVRRILRVKMRAGLWHKPKPSERRLAGKPSALNNSQHRALAREAVRKSLVLLKNEQQVLPLSGNQKILLTGSAANDIQKQTGGWNLTWQGTENTLDDFPNATTVKSALEQILGSDNVLFSPKLDTDISDIDIAVVAFGEDPYAEMMGDIKPWQTLQFSGLKRSYKQDIAKIHRLKNEGIKVVCLFFSGRPLYLNEEIAAADAFVACFLPGTEALGIADVIIGDKDSCPRYDFTGRLSFSWPNKKLSAAVNHIPEHIPGYLVPASEQDPQGEHAPLFPYGYGLNYSDRKSAPEALKILPDTSEPHEAYNALELFGVRSAIGDYITKIVAGDQDKPTDISLNNPMTVGSVTTIPYNYQLQQDAVQIQFGSQPASFYIQTSDHEEDDLNQFSTLSFDVLVNLKPQRSVMLSMGSNNHSSQLNSDTGVEMKDRLSQSSHQWQTIEIKLDSLLSHGDRKVNTPFVLTSHGELDLVLGNIRLY